jgi:hypothetical protein
MRNIGRRGFVRHATFARGGRRATWPDLSPEETDELYEAFDLT